MILFDTHCHIDMTDFDADREEVLLRARTSGVKKLLIPATSLSSLKKVIHSPWRDEFVYIAAGIHPHEVKDISISTMNELKNFILDFPEIKAIGETGLDFFYDYDYAERQITFFEDHIEFAETFSKPLIVHCRNAKENTGRFVDAYKYVLDMVEHTKVKGVLHSFTGTLADARRAVELGWYISFNGILTFRNSSSLRETVRQIPLERVLIETDSPYLSPVPLRGKRNEPANLNFILVFLSELLNMEIEELCLLITNNSEKLFA